MMATTAPSGHLDFTGRPQQPISTPNRTSHERQIPDTPTSPRNIPAPSSVAPSMPLLADQSRGESRSHMMPLDLHAQSAPAAIATFQRQPFPVSVEHVPIDWSLYGTAHPSIPLHQAPYHHFDPSQAPIIPHLPHHPPTDPALTYAPDLVSPASIHHPSHPQFPYVVPWDDGAGHESATPTVTTPAGQISNNPWIDPEDTQNEEDPASQPQAMGKNRPRRSRRNTRQPGESAAGPSVEPTSPSSVSQQSRTSVTSKSTSVASTSTSSGRQSKLRSASRTSKNSHNKPSDTPEDRRTRASHNLVEKQYRNRLNAQFESLLQSLPEQVRNGGDGEDSEGHAPTDLGDKRVSKGEVLEMARKHIQSLERERDQLEREKNDLLGNLRRLKGSVSDTTNSSGQRTPLEFNISMDDEDPEDTTIEEAEEE